MAFQCNNLPSLPSITSAGYSSFASPGTGGALYVKFSAAKLLSNTFKHNWVTAGGNEASIGGAVAGPCSITFANLNACISIIIYMSLH